LALGYPKAYIGTPRGEVCFVARKDNIFKKIKIFDFLPLF